MLTSVLSLFCLLTITYAKRQYYANLSRSRAYLCMKQQLEMTYSYTKVMRVMNISIRSAYALSFIPKMKAVHQSLQSVQQLYHISFVQKLATKGSCHFTQRVSFFYNLPYQNTGIFILRKRLDGTAWPAKDKEWTYSLSNYAKRKEEKPSFILKAKVSFKKEKLKLVSTQEEEIVAWSQSQLSSYLASLVRWLPLP